MLTNHNSINDGEEQEAVVKRCRNYIQHVQTATHNTGHPVYTISCYSVNLAEKYKTFLQETRNSSTKRVERERKRDRDRDRVLYFSPPSPKWHREISSPFRTPWRSYPIQQSHHATYCYFPAYFFFIFIFLCLTSSSVPLPFLHPEFHSSTYSSLIPSLVLLILMTYLLSSPPSTVIFPYLSACDPLQLPPDTETFLATKPATTSNLRVENAFMKLPPSLCIARRVSSNSQYWFFISSNRHR